ncbi:metalloregulator ArsR/SmtB family transcription factor [Microbacterium sp. H1-D42]|uniref:metalloregulator ArsR/SmtB family transcription factor n=1 Tax=Microbacterium sp. H1-D42 TaxID=2925844 RepID=UPI001F534723|nr:metalloregulator ArsR/SmtB family transcription factor [Microbacterium sp. H1-D42]UNK70736.1 metalloregulator ArsR/SmtB family transcription factor [Microbacterium sp. H1-D42]
MNAALAGPVDNCTPVAAHAIGLASATTVADALKSLADPLRLRILSAISTDPRGEVCVCDLSELADVSQPTISHHLKVLKETGMLLSERRGTWVYYRIAPARQGAVTALLDAFAPAATLDAAEDGAERTKALRTMDARVTRLAEELADELTELNHDLVVAITRESFAGLVRSAKLTQHMIPLTERFARQRLADLSRDRTAGTAQVLFVCVANAGRSQLAAALVNRLADGKVIARSAGSAPASDVHPHVRSLLAEVDSELEAGIAFPKPLTDDAVRAADIVVTMGCGDVCPIIPGIRYEDWSVGDPALASPEGAAAIRDDIEARVRDLLTTLTTDHA